MERRRPGAQQAVQQRALTLYGTAAPHRWPAPGANSSPLCRTTIPHTFYNNSFGIIERKIRGGGGGNPTISLLRPMKPPRTHLKVSQGQSCGS